jgi:hypothetical protein
MSSELLLLVSMARFRRISHAAGNGESPADHGSQRSLHRHNRCAIAGSIA